MATINIGDHIYSPRKGYTHHGIYIGDNEVVHYSGFVNGRKGGKIEVTTLRRFQRGNSVHVRRYTDKSKFDANFHMRPARKYSAEKTVERALSRLDEDWYNVLVNNCEHFACWCVTGRHSSEQVKDAVLTSAEIARLIKALQMAGEWTGRPPLPTKPIPGTVVTKRDWSEDVRTITESVRSLSKVDKTRTILEMHMPPSKSGGSLDATSKLVRAVSAKNAVALSNSGAMKSATALSSAGAMSGAAALVSGVALTGGVPLVATVASVVGLASAAKGLYDWIVD